MGAFSYGILPRHLSGAVGVMGDSAYDFDFTRIDGEGQQSRVLVVERAEHLTHLLEDVPTEPLLIVHMALNARQALRRLASGFYDAVVVHLPLAQTTAAELYRVIAWVDRKQADRLVFVAPDLSDPATRKFLSEARRPFLTKPVEAYDLYQLVLRVAEGAPPHPSIAQDDLPGSPGQRPGDAT